MRLHRITSLLGTFAALSLPLAAQQLDSASLQHFRWRNVGPANMGGRITDVAGIPWPSRTFYVSTAAGGVFKSTNAGTSFRAVLDTARIASGGSLAIAPSDTNTVYFGTGEQNSRNTISPGGGLYKTTDGGRSWKFMGLAETQQIGRIIVHPRDPNTVYVAALGHAWGPNPERGLYKTTDGGTTWKLVKFVSDKAGFIDVTFDPRNPDVVWASSYERQRGPYFLQSGGPGSALWKSTDAGATWTEVKGGGFPETTKGRINIAISLSSPDVMYTMVEADTLPHKKEAGVKSQKSPSGLYRSEDGGKTWTKTNDENTRPFYYSQVRVHPTLPNRVYWSSTPVKFSDDGGKTARNATEGIHVDHHAMWIDPKDPSHIIVGNDGGIAQTWDGGGNYDYMNQIALGQFYGVSYDNAVPYNVCAGAQDNGSWCGPSRRKQGSITNSMWFTYNGGDGFITAQDPTNPDIIFGESQGGNIGRYRVSTGERTALQKPAWRNKYTAWEDSILVERPDTTKPMAKEQAKRVADLRAKQKTDSLDLDLRWNWNTPYFISNFNPQTMYFGASRVLKSTKAGDDMYFISPDLTYRDTTKIRVSMKTTGGITVDPTGAETYATIVTLNESPRKPGMLVAGTDDGRVWITRNDGGAWEELTSRFKGVPAGTYVSRAELSHFDENNFWVTFDNHRNNDFMPYVFATTDGGKTFASIANNLPTGAADFVHVIREDTKNANLLFAGTDVGAYVSMNKGKTWQRFMTGLPTTPVHDLQIHPRDGDLIAATHGRSIWIVDINALQQMDETVVAKAAHLFKSPVAHQYGGRPYNGESTGNKLFQGQSAQYGAEILYRLTAANTGPVKVVIQNAMGDTVQTLNGPGAVGINRVMWDFRGKAPPAEKLSPAGVRDSIATARKSVIALDSIEKEGTVPKAMLDRVRAAMNSPEGLTGFATQMFAQFAGGGGGGAFGGAPRFNERPAETSPAPGGRRGAPAPAEGAGEGAAPPDQNQLFGIFRALGGTFGGGGGRRGGGGGSLVNTGDYLVTITIGGQAQKTLLRVERVSGSGAIGGFFEEDDR
jgi:photosystem II stability/assembly factor-like uncharacterized protein